MSDGEWGAAIASLERAMAASVLGSIAVTGPEPLRCPVDGWTRERCLAFWGRDPVHEQAIRDALR